MLALEIEILFVDKVLIFAVEMEASTVEIVVIFSNAPVSDETVRDEMVPDANWKDEILADDIEAFVVEKLSV
jgi:hypothetical protein